MSTITISFAQQLGLEIKKLKKRFIDVEGKGGRWVPYFSYVELNLKIPEGKTFDEDSLMLVIDNSYYGSLVPIQIVTLHIDRMLALVTPAELDTLNKQWTCR